MRNSASLDWPKLRKSEQDQLLWKKQIDRNFDGTLNHEDGVIDWQVGDEIVIASSTRDYADEEVRTIIGISDADDGRQILALDAPLEKRHYGEIENLLGDERFARRL